MKCILINILPRTYLEKEFESFANCSKDQLIRHALKALASSLSGDSELDSKSASIAIVGVDHPFEIIEGNAIQRYLDALEVADIVGMKV